MKFKEALNEAKPLFDLGDWVSLKPSGYPALQKQNPKEKVEKYPRFYIDKVSHDGDRVHVASSFLDDPKVRLRAVSGDIKMADIKGPVAMGKAVKEK